MVYRACCVVGLVLMSLNGLGQSSDIDSLRRLVERPSDDTVQMLAFSSLAEYYAELDPDSLLYFGGKALELSRKPEYKLNEVDALAQMGYALINLGDYPRALQIDRTALAIAEDPSSEDNVLTDRLVNYTKYLERPVTTQQQNGAVEILVKDNGKGIPVAIKDKILQPFFTTKPAGQGTGLGLSLSYDIITKGHYGSMKVESAEGSGSIFYVQLPTTKP
jgi:signal transduction histidine kinase